MLRSVSVVIPNYNGAHLLEKNLPTVVSALNEAHLDFEIIVTDDASTDASLELLKTKFPQVIVLTSQGNQGFSKNINKGLRHAKKDLVLALNSDVSLTRDYFKNLLPLFENPKLFGVVGALKDPKTDQIIDAAKIHRRTIFGEITATKNILPFMDRPFSTFYLSGANALVDRKKLAEIGYFNEIFSPFYGEDTDLGFTAWRKGWDCLFDPRSIAYHETSSTILTYNKQDRIRRVSRRNKFLFHEIHLSGIRKLVYFGKLAFDVATRWVGLDFNFYKAFLDYLQIRQQLKNHRRPVEDQLNSSETTLHHLRKIQHVENVRVF